jgi:hypothetical protein
MYFAFNAKQLSIIHEPVNGWLFLKYLYIKRFSVDWSYSVHVHKLWIVALPSIHITLIPSMF